MWGHSVTASTPVVELLPKECALYLGVAVN